MAIAYNNLEIIKLLVEAGAVIDQRAVGSFFLPKDQQRARPAQRTDYEGLAYFGELPLAWAACCNNEAAYNLLVDRGADPNVQDSFGNMVLHMVVVRDKLVISTINLVSNTLSLYFFKGYVRLCPEAPALAGQDGHCEQGRLHTVVAFLPLG